MPARLPSLRRSLLPRVLLLAVGGAGVLWAPLPSAPGLSAQEPGSAPERRSLESLFVPAGHWVLGALARLDAFPELGAAVPWGVGSPSRREVLAALERAASDAGPGGPPGRIDSADRAALARAWRDRFLMETGGPPEEDAGPVRWIGGHWDLRLGRRYGALGTGEGMFDFVPPEPLGDARHLHASVGGALAAGPVAVAGELRIREDGSPGTRELYVAGRLGPVDLWAGRRAPAFGGGRGGAVALGGQVPLDGGGFALAGPRTLPGFLGRLGPVRFESHLARFDENGPILRPWFWNARGSVQPHPRLGVALNRAALFGGEGSPPTTFKNVLLTLLGTRAGEDFGEMGRSFFANQILSVELRWRPPVEAVPTTLYVEWGMEDSAGAWLNVPGIVAGVEVAGLPGAPGASVGIEVSHFAPECCANPPWYRHANFSGGWADEGLPLGHPLGGEGTEWLLHGRVDLLGARLVSSWRLFHRKRAGANLFMPTREGTSRGGAVEVLYRVGERTDLAVDAFHERGREGWSELRAFLGIRAYF